MAYGNMVTVEGNLARDPELRYTPNGRAVASFGLAWNQRKGGRDGQEAEDVAHFFDVVAWGELGENVAETLTKGMRVVVTGRLDHRRWQNDQGENRSKVEIVADTVGPCLRWASATVTKNDRRNGGGGGGSRSSAVPPAYDEDEEPF